MQAVVFIYLFIFGAFAGSFLNLISDRLPVGKKIVFGRSVCDFCKKTLKVKNLIPIFSFIFQKGRCSFCNKKLSFYHPFSELLTGVAFMLAGHLSKFSYEINAESVFLLFYYIVVFSFFIVMVLTDMKFCLILDSVIIPSIIFVFLTSIIFRFLDLSEIYGNLKNDSFGVYLLRTDFFTNRVFMSLKDFGYVVGGAILIALFFQFLIFITKGRGMGDADVKLGFLIGLVNGFPMAFMAVFMGYVLGAFYSVFLMLMKKKTMKDSIPFGPFLILGSVLILLFGNQIWLWYSGLGSLF